MKQRLGFVSNSSSSCYILDLCDKETEDIVHKLKKSNVVDLSNPTAATFSRCTCFGVGEAVTNFAEEHEEYQEEDTWDDEDEIDNSFSAWLYHAIEQLGEKNTVFIRISDEDDGLPLTLNPELIYAETEYH